MSVNQQTVEETKAQIRGLVNEIAQLAKSGATADEFYPELLSRIITALAAHGGAIWLLDEDRQIKLQYQINAEPSILADDTDDAAIISAIIAMAHQLRLSVIAEGVETDEQLNFLRAHQCDVIQGYLVSEPLSPDDCVEVYTGWSPAHPQTWLAN